MNKILRYSSAVCAVLFCALLIITVFTRIVRAQQSPLQLSGYGWSDTIGWTSFTDTNSNVFFDPATGNLTGYAWLGNIGWVKFGGLSNFPSGGGTTAANAQVNLTTGAVTGWARACGGTVSSACATKRTDGWDGWISLSGTGVDGSSYGLTYNTSTGNFSGFAWGSDVVGWIQWNPAGGNPVTTNPSGNPPSVTIAANPNPVTAGSPTTLTWTATNNPSSCTMSSSPATTPTGTVASTSSGTQTGIINSPTDYSLTCSNASGSGSNEVTVSTTTTGSQNNPPANSTVKMWLDNDPTETLTHIPLHPSDSATLNWDGTAFTNAYPPMDTPACRGGVNTGQSVPTWTTSQQPQAPDNSSNVVTLSGLSVGTYSLYLRCSANVGGNNVASTSNNVTITVTNSTIHEQ